MDTTLVKTFENADFGKVRIVMIDGEPWFVAKDVCDCLEIANSREAITRLDEDELTSVKLTSGGQMREMKVVNEFGLYNLILSSRKKEAKKFKRWVTHEVLPSIRKTGSDGTAPAAPYVLIPKFFRGKQVITIKDAAAILNVSRNLIEEIINKPTANIHEGTDYLRLKGEDRAEFKRDNPSIPRVVHHIIAILKSGFEKICDYLKVKTLPNIFKMENLETALDIQEPSEYTFNVDETIQDIREYKQAQETLFKLYKSYKPSSDLKEAIGKTIGQLGMRILEGSFKFGIAQPEMSK